MLHMTWNQTSRRAALGALAAAALAVAAALPARAKEQRLVEPQHTGGITFINGGVGKEQEAYMHRIAKAWPLRMTFSERKDDEFVAGVNLRVTDHGGAPVFSLHNAGPMTYARLPPGKYRVTARFKGQTEVRDVALDGKAGADVYFHWKGRPAIDPWDGKPMGGKHVPG